MDIHPQESRGGGTGIPAAVLALLGGIFHLIGVAGGALLMAGETDLGHALLTFLLHLVVAATLIVGGVGLILAKPFGRTFTIAGSILALLLYVAVLVLASFGVFFLGEFARAMPARYVALLCVPALATAVLASLRPTARWVTSGWS